MDQQQANARMTEIKASGLDDSTACRQLVSEGATFDQAVDACWAYAKKPQPTQSQPGGYTPYTKSQRAWDHGFERKHHSEE